jgi:glycopeptide antibiotics resistance protein
MRAVPTLELKLLLLWGLFILYGAILPFDLSASLDTVAREWSQAQKVPWRGPEGGLPPLPDAIANVLLFLPWGFLFALHRTGRGAGARSTILGGALSALGFSVLVETLQLFSHSRMTSATDLTTNTAGGLLGAAAGWCVGARLRTPVEALLGRELARRPLAVLAAAASALTLFWAVSPYDLSFDLDYLKSSIKATRPVPFGPPLRGSAPAEEPLERISEVLAWSLLGGVIAGAARAEGRWRGPRLGMVSLGLVMALAAGTEGVQLLVRSRTTDATTVFFAWLGGAGGVAFVLASRVRAGLAPAAICVWLAATLLAGLSPWRFELPRGVVSDPLRFLPFLHHFHRTDVGALADTFLQALFYAPLGALLAARSIEVSPRRAAAAGCAVAAAVEILQVFVPGRTADTTDVALAGIGAYAAARLWRWALSERRRIRSQGGCAPASDRGPGTETRAAEVTIRRARPRSRIGS